MYHCERPYSSNIYIGQKHSSSATSAKHEPVTSGSKASICCGFK
jgi:hypothetical protein